MLCNMQSEKDLGFINTVSTWGVRSSLRKLKP